MDFIIMMNGAVVQNNNTSWAWVWAKLWGLEHQNQTINREKRQITHTSSSFKNQMKRLLVYIVYILISAFATNDSGQCQ
jgi:hypothetical protein